MEPSSSGVGLEDPSAVQWTLLDCSGDIPSSEGLHGHTSVLHNGRLYIFGGAAQGFASDQFYVFDLAERRWTASKPTGVDLPVSADHSAIKVGDSMLIYGGRGHAQRRKGVDSNIPQPIYNHLYRYYLEGPKAGSAEIMTQSIPGPRRKAFSLVLHSNYLWLFGGWDHQRIFDQMWRLDVSSLLSNTDDPELKWEEVKQKGDIPMKRHGHSAHIWRGKMLVFGGTSGFSLELGYVHHDEVCLFDFETLEWTALKPEGDLKPPGNESHGSLLVNDYLVVWGGRDSVDFNEDLYILDLISLKWRKVQENGQRPPPRCCMCAEVISTDETTCRAVVVGGYGPRYFWGAEDATEFEEYRDMFGRIQLRPLVEPFLRYKDVYYLDIPIKR